MKFVKKWWTLSFISWTFSKNLIVGWTFSTTKMIFDKTIDELWSIFWWTLSNKNLEFWVCGIKEKFIICLIVKISQHINIFSLFFEKFIFFLIMKSSSIKMDIERSSNKKDLWTVYYFVCEFSYYFLLKLHNLFAQRSSKNIALCSSKTSDSSSFF